MIEKDNENSPGIINSRFLRNCNAIEESPPAGPFGVIIFGGTGDLAARMILPSFFHLYQDGELNENFIIIGTGRSVESTEEYRAFVKESISAYSAEDKSVPEKFLSKVYFFRMDIRDSDKYTELDNQIQSLFENIQVKPDSIILYLAVAPHFFEHVINSGGGQFHFIKNVNIRVVVEKPFGHNRKSAAHLNSVLGKYFAENNIFRIDHYLGKETVQNIIFLRFSNSIFEPLWNNRFIDNVQITVGEAIGIGRRGDYYDKAGVIRDMIQNHMMQLISLIAMEAPAGFEADFVRDEKLKVLKSFRPYDQSSLREFIFGQYTKGLVDGENAVSYRDEFNVSEYSKTPTFIAGKFYIDNWRWAGVPFYFRCGKRLRRRVTEICIEFKQPPLRLFGRTCDSFYPNLLVITIQPEEEIKLRLGIKYPGENNKIYLADLKFNYPETFNIRKHPPYERLILDCLSGDLTLFARQDSIEVMWDIVDPLIEFSEEDLSSVYSYHSGSWGPSEADFLLNKGRTWYTK